MSFVTRVMMSHCVTCHAGDQVCPPYLARVCTPLWLRQRILVPPPTLHQRRRPQPPGKYRANVGKQGTRNNSWLQGIADGAWHQVWDCGRRKGYNGLCLFPSELGICPKLRSVDDGDDVTTPSGQENTFLAGGEYKLQISPPDGAEGGADCSEQRHGEWARELFSSDRDLQPLGLSRHQRIREDWTEVQ